MSSRKVIKPEVIRSVEAALSGVDASSLLKQGSAASIEDDSRAAIEAFSQAVDKTTEDIKQNRQKTPDIRKVWEYFEKGTDSGYSLYELEYEAFAEVIKYLEKEDITLPWGAK